MTFITRILKKYLIRPFNCLLKVLIRTKANVINSISAVDQADINFERIKGSDFLNVSEVQKEYERWTKEIAKRNIGFIDDGVAHEKYKMQNEIDVWHICTKKFTYPAMKKMLEKHFPDKKFVNGLDLGCGTVTFFDFIEVEKTTLVDLSEDYCRFMNAKGWDVLNENIENLSVKSFSQDIVICSDVLEHVLSFDKAISEVFRVLAPNGILLVNVPWKQRLEEIPAILGSHIRTFNDKNLSERFNGFKIIAKEIIGPTVKPNGIKTINLILTKSVTDTENIELPIS